jgi:dephospho-CoA kinase
MALLNGIHVLSLIGRQGTGKTTTGRQISEDMGCLHIEASDVVRSVVARAGKSTRREDLPESNKRTAEEPEWLGNAVAEVFDESCSILKRNRVKPGTDLGLLVLTGAREVEVHETLEQHGAHVFTVALDAPKLTRYERLKLLGKASSYEYFENQDHAEGEIGLDLLLTITQYALKSGAFTQQGHVKAAILALWKAEMENERSK